MDTNGSDVTVDDDPGEDLYHASYDFETVSPGLAVVEAIAAVEEIEPLDMEPLGATVDLEALDSLLRSGTGRAGPTVALRVRGYEILLHGSGRLVLQRLDSEPGDGAPEE